MYLYMHIYIYIYIYIYQDMYICMYKLNQPMTYIGNLWMYVHSTYPIRENMIRIAAIQTRNKLV